MKTSEDLLKIIIKYAVLEKELESINIDSEKNKKSIQQAVNTYKHTYKFYAHHYLAISYIYHSMINSSNSYCIMVKNHMRDFFKVSNEGEEKFYLSINEPFCQHILLQYAKLNEVLPDLDLECHRNDREPPQSVKQLLCTEKLITSYQYLHSLNQKIKQSKIQNLRNNLFAHPFKDEKKKSVVFLDEVSNSLMLSLRALCDEKDQIDFDSSPNRILFFCEKYLSKGYERSYMKHRYYKNGGNERICTHTTKSQKHINEIYSFMEVIKSEALLSIEPILRPDIKNLTNEINIYFNKQ